MHEKTAARRKQPPKRKRIGVTFRCDLDIYTDINEVCWELRISRPEFLRRAVARELAYNARVPFAKALKMPRKKA